MIEKILNSTLYLIGMPLFAYITIRITDWDPKPIWHVGIIMSLIGLWRIWMSSSDNEDNWKNDVGAGKSTYKPQNPWKKKHK